MLLSETHPIGTTVRLKGGSPLMTVCAYDDHGKVLVAWFPDSCNCLREAFFPGALEIVSEDGDNT